MITIRSFPRRRWFDRPTTLSEVEGEAVIPWLFLDSGSPLRCGRNDVLNCRINRYQRLLQPGNDLSALYNNLLNPKLYIEYQDSTCGLPGDRNPDPTGLQLILAFMANFY